jgi:hypothetical protein
MFIIDWEMAQSGVLPLDLGQMIAELYLLKVYKDIDAGLWMIEGFVSGYGVLQDDAAFRTAIAVGTHLICFGGTVPGWGTPEQVERCVAKGKDIVVNAWRKNRRWFEEGDLCRLFT